METHVTCGKNHELLHGEFVASMTPAIDDVEGGNRQNDVFVSRQICDVTIQGHALEANSQSGNQKRQPIRESEC